MSKKKRNVIVWGMALLALLLIVSGSYIAWNRVEPNYTCAQCHEVAPSHDTWSTSAHADVHCIECHGSALESVHAATEKLGMVWTHFTGNRHPDDVHLNERQALEVMERCIVCHRAEHAGWLAGGHAVTYDEIFMDSLHNSTEKPYWDCLRCHGMYYDGNIHDLMELSGSDAREWYIKDEKQAEKFTIPCLACHQVHTDNPVSERYVSMEDSVARAERERHPVTSFYVRTDKVHLRSDKLLKIEMLDADGEPLEGVASDPATMLCLQCHSPNYKHYAGSQDDRTVMGDHMGISCIACHKPHSGETKQSCVMCHPDLTEQEIEDVFEKPHTYQTIQ